MIIVHCSVLEPSSKDGHPFNVLNTAVAHSLIAESLSSRCRQNTVQRAPASYTSGSLASSNRALRRCGVAYSLHRRPASAAVAASAEVMRRPSFLARSCRVVVEMSTYSLLITEMMSFAPSLKAKTVRATLPSTLLKPMKDVFRQRDHIIALRHSLVFCVPPCTTFFSSASSAILLYTGIILCATSVVR